MKSELTEEANVPEAAIVAHLTRQANMPFSPKEGYEASSPVVVIPEDCKLAKLDVLPERPSRVRASLEFITHESFCRYVTDHKNNTSIIFAEINDQGGSFKAVLDYHGFAGNAPSHCTHLVGFTPAHSTNWLRWKQANGQPMTQEAFALFLENNLLDITQPSGADLLKIATDLEIDGKVTFRKAQRLQDGTVNFHYQNDQQASAGGTIRIPEIFELTLPVFEDEPPSVFLARFRFKLSPDGQVTFRFELVNPHTVIRGAMNALVERVKVGTGITPLCGKFTNTAKY